MRDVGLAEELAQDALVVALEQWPESGVPDNPGAWLMTTAKRRAIDHFRRRKRLERKHRAARLRAGGAGRGAAPDLDAALDDDIGDDLLRLMFTACHPVLSTEARIALTLRLVGGLTTDEIARAYLVPEPTIAQRIVRAKRTLAEARVPFEVPRGAERAARLSSVLEVLYLVFNEGYSATAGEDWMRPALCEDALRLGPHPGRARAAGAGGPRAGRAHGDPGLAHRRAHRPVGGADPAPRPEPRALGPAPHPSRPRRARSAPRSWAARAGPYALQAAIAACHARARTADETDWPRIAALYEALAEVDAVAGRGAEPRGGGRHGVRSPGRPRDRRRGSPSEPLLEGYHLLPSVRGDLLARLGRYEESRAEFERAASLTRNAREREVLLGRAARSGQRAEP